MSGVDIARINRLLALGEAVELALANREAWCRDATLYERGDWGAGAYFGADRMLDMIKHQASKS